MASANGRCSRQSVGATVDYLLVFVGGGLGSVTRFAVGSVFARWLGTAWPTGTLVINVSGSFLIGLFLTLAGEKWGLSPSVRYFVATGFVGGYTTFSTFEYETQRLVEVGASGYAGLYVAASVVLGFGAALLGVAIARRA
jgi:fluoride exporter